MRKSLKEAAIQFTLFPPPARTQHLPLSFACGRLCPVAR